MNERLVFGSPIEACSSGSTRRTTLRASTGSVLHRPCRRRIVGWNSFDARTNEFLKDKLIALDRGKAEFCYHVCRALRARRVVEAGTSFGVSTLYLAAAVRDNLPQGAHAQAEGNEPAGRDRHGV